MTVELKGFDMEAPKPSPSMQHLIEHVARFCDAHFANFGCIHPMWHADTGDRWLIITATNMEDRDDKNQVTAHLRDLFAEENVQRYVSVVESWYLDFRTTAGMDPQEIKRIMHEGLAHHPARKEMVAITAEDAQQLYAYSREILRPNDGEAHLGPLVELPTREMQGRFIGMLSHLKAGRLQ